MQKTNAKIQAQSGIRTHDLWFKIKLNVRVSKLHVRLSKLYFGASILDFGHSILDWILEYAFLHKTFMGFMMFSSSDNITLHLVIKDF